jgi:hypothetical protein
VIAAFRPISRHAHVWALAVLFVAFWLAADALFDGRPSTTDALQASASISNDLAAEEAARKGTQ